jgi:hypothetical protein
VIVFKYGKKCIEHFLIGIRFILNVPSMNIPPKTIDEVLLELDLIIDTAIKENSPLGYFAYLYRRVTAQIKQAVSDNQFEDNARMQKMDVAFANLYLVAFYKFRNGESISESWRIAFQAKDENLTIIQHLILGMNAHINLDLGIAAASVAPGDKIISLKNDFMKVNQILRDLTNEMQNRVARVSRLMFLLDWIGKNHDEEIINFSIVKAREQSWRFAGVLAYMTDTEKKRIIDETDNTISKLAALLKRPPLHIVHYILRIISFFEDKNVNTIITKLEES